jgi:hypothetical protein
MVGVVKENKMRVQNLSLQLPFQMVVLTTIGSNDLSTSDKAKVVELD